MPNPKDEKPLQIRLDSSAPEKVGTADLPALPTILQAPAPRSTITIRVEDAIAAVWAEGRRQFVAKAKAEANSGAIFFLRDRYHQFLFEMSDRERKAYWIRLLADLFPTMTLFGDDPEFVLGLEERLSRELDDRETAGYAGPGTSEHRYIRQLPSFANVELTVLSRLKRLLSRSSS